MSPLVIFLISLFFIGVAGTIYYFVVLKTTKFRYISIMSKDKNMFFISDIVVYNKIGEKLDITNATEVKQVIDNNLFSLAEIKDNLILDLGQDTEIGTIYIYNKQDYGQQQLSNCNVLLESSDKSKKSELMISDIRNLYVINVDRKGNMKLSDNAVKYAKEDFKTNLKGVWKQDYQYNPPNVVLVDDKQDNQYITVYSKGEYGLVDLGEQVTNNLFKDYKIFKRDCLNCGDDYRQIFYKRITDIPENFSIYSQFNNWTNVNNVLNTDFKLYSTLEDLINDTNAWDFCDYNDPNIGFPRDCGFTNASRMGGQWNSLTKGGQPNVKYSIVTLGQVVYYDDKNCTNNPFNGDNLVGLYEVDSFDATNGKWNDKSGKENHATVVGGVTIEEAPIDETNVIKTLSGGITAGVVFPTAILPSVYTLITVARHTSEIPKTKGRIFDGLNKNWLSGFWGGQNSVAFHEGWITNNSGNPTDSTWVLSVDSNDSYYANGINKTKAIVGGKSSDQLTINQGVFKATEASDWNVAYVAVFNRKLNFNERVYVENMLKNKFNLSSVTPSNYLLGLTKECELRNYKISPTNQSFGNIVYLNTMYNGLEVIKLGENTDKYGILNAEKTGIKVAKQNNLGGGDVFSSRVDFVLTGDEINLVTVDNKCKDARVGNLTSECYNQILNTIGCSEDVNNWNLNRKFQNVNWGSFTKTQVLDWAKTTGNTTLLKDDAFNVIKMNKAGWAQQACYGVDKLKWIYVPEYKLVRENWFPNEGMIIDKTQNGINSIETARRYAENVGAIMFVYSNDSNEYKYYTRVMISTDLITNFNIRGQQRAGFNVYYDFKSEFEPCMFYNDSSINVSEQCYASLFKKSGCLTRPNYTSEDRNRSYIDLINRVNTLANSSNDSDKMTCYGENKTYWPQSWATVKVVNSSGEAYVPMRINRGKVECMSLNNRDCLWKNTQTESDTLIVGLPGIIKPLSSSGNYSENGIDWPSQGYRYLKNLI
jgi:hypothetical protein